MNKKFYQQLLWLLFILSAGLVIYWWWQISGSLFADNIVGDNFIALGRLAGLLGMFGILWQLVLIGRLTWIEKWFGLDRLSRMHHYNGLVAMVLLCLHPLFLIFGYAPGLGNSWWGQLIDFIWHWQNVLLATIAFVLLAIVVATSVIIVYYKYSYEKWYYIHFSIYAVIVLAFWHQLSVGTDLQNKSFQTYWIILYIFTLGNLLYFRFLRPVFNYYQQDWRVTKIVAENDNITSIYIRGKNLAKFKIRAGQFAIFRFFSKGFWYEAHPFSFSAQPHDNLLRVTVKSLGDFTGKVKNISEGTKVLIDGPHGVFTSFEMKTKKFLLLAGGIGITPLRALTEKLLAEQADVVLLWGNRTQQDIFWQTEWSGLQTNTKFHLHHILSGEEYNDLQPGYITIELIQRLASDWREREIYLCGPRLMMSKLLLQMKQTGVPTSKIHWEKFSL